MIVTVTLNPSLDKALSVSRLVPGQVHRAGVLRQDAGGKGINASRALRALGLESRIIGFVAGAAGEALRDRLSAEGYEATFIEVGGETRQNLTLLDESSGLYTKINEPGAAPTPTQVAALAAAMERQACPGDLWAFCGSLPPGVPEDVYAQLIQLVQSRGALAFLDSSGPALKAGVAARPFGVKPNSEEAGEWVGRPLLSLDDHVAAARQLYEAGVAVTAITRGELGAVFNFHGDVLVAHAPRIDARSPVGAGDAALAGLLWAVCDRCDPQETARRVIACGAAAALQEGTEMGDRPLVQELLGRVQLSGPPAPCEERT